MIRLITAFQPFAGRPKNGSATLLAWLRRRLRDGGSHTRVLPVTWRGGPTRLRRALATYRPQVVIGLGEGTPDEVRWEIRAQNRRAGPDVLGTPPTSEKIDPLGPEERRGKVPRKLPVCEIPWRISEDAGVFLCNHVLWEILAYAPTHGAFFHLPPQADTPDAEYVQRLGPAVLEAVTHVMAR